VKFYSLKQGLTLNNYQFKNRTPLKNRVIVKITTIIALKLKNHKNLFLQPNHDFLPNSYLCPLKSIQNEY